MELLDEFYKNRSVPFEDRLIFEGSDTYGVIRLINQGGEIEKIFPPKKRKKNLERYRKEMEDFGTFLKEKFFH